MSCSRKLAVANGLVIAEKLSYSRTIDTVNIMKILRQNNWYNKYNEDSTAEHWYNKYNEDAKAEQLYSK